MVYLTRKEYFCASHRLFNPKFSDEKNLQIYGKCAYANGHGHNYELEVTVVGEPVDETGMILDLKILSDIIKKEITDKVDHRHLNIDVDFLQGIIPTAENIAIIFWNILAPKIPVGKLYSLKVYETPNNFAEYRG
ncbi:MAG: 6-carboxytetrahydropterin synthase [Ignavibacteriae bacterium]|nr:6-carboxytetrahydropterin synthase [Ignavibacteriota bacterium]